MVVLRFMSSEQPPHTPRIAARHQSHQGIHARLLQPVHELRMCEAMGWQLYCYFVRSSDGPQPSHTAHTLNLEHAIVIE